MHSDGWIHVRGTVLLPSLKWIDFKFCARFVFKLFKLIRRARRAPKCHKNKYFGELNSMGEPQSKREGEEGRCGGCEGENEYLRLTTHKSHKINQGSEAQQTRTCCYSRVSCSSISHSLPRAALSLSFSLYLSLSLSLMGCLEQLVTVDKSKQMLIS